MECFPKHSTLNSKLSNSHGSAVTLNKHTCCNGLQLDFFLGFEHFNSASSLNCATLDLVGNSMPIVFKFLAVGELYNILKL